MFFRLISIAPLSLIFYVIFCSFWEKINSINGLRKTRITLMILMLALLMDQFYFLYLGINAAVKQVPVIYTGPVMLFLDKLLMTASFFTLYYLFRHTAKRGIKHE